MKWNAAKHAFPVSLPICAGFLFLGASYGILMTAKGFSPIYPFIMSLFIFAGSMEFVTINLLLSSFHPLSAFLLTLMVNARHLFYGISMLEKYQGTGRKKAYLIFGMCDESFSINCSAKIPQGIDKGWYMFFVTLFNHIYWVFGAAAGAILGKWIPMNIKGIEFVMTALFVVIFLNQWQETQNHKPACSGLIITVFCLLLFGAENFLIPALLLITGILILLEKEMKYV